jgi:hypothetical protein
MKSSKHEGYVVLFEPATTNDFWKAKFLLEAVEIQYKVEGQLYSTGVRLGVTTTSIIVVREEDEGPASLICHELIEKAKKKEKELRNYKPTFFEKFIDFFRIN